MSMNKMSKVGALLVLGGALIAAPACKKVSGTPDVAQTGTLYADADDKYGVVGSPYKGNADALVTIVVFSEFQCPFCARVNPTLDEILKKYGDDVRIVFKNLPLDFHDRAEPAARAALAAGEQGKFWEFHDIAFENQRTLTDENFEKWAAQLNLDIEKFKADYNSEAITARVAADAKLAAELGVRGTPNLFVNGHNVRGAQPFSAFEPIIDAELAATRALVEGGQTPAQALAARIAENHKPAEAAAAPQARPTPDPNDVLYVPIEQSPTKGSEKALVTWVIFSEFQCPFCDRIRPTVEAMQERFGDKLRIVYKHNPLDFHPRAEPAARASIAAQNQGKFWEYHDLLFSNMSDLSDEAFVRHATTLGLNLDKFKADMEAPETAARIQADVTLGRRVLAQGTPHSFVNGVRVRGAAPAPQFEQIIQAQIEKAEAALTPAQRNNPYEALQADANRGEARMTNTAPTPAAPQAPPAAVEIPVTDANPSRGPADAKVTLVEYTDFECPFCGRFAANLDEALKAPELDGKIRVVVKQFPLNFHVNAELTAQAALAANAQGKFWEYHDVIWPNMRALDRASLERYAEQVGLNMQQFRADLDANKYQAQVRAEFAEGQRFGVQGTPTWFVNGVRYSGALPPEQIKQILLDALNAAN